MPKAKDPNLNMTPPFKCPDCPAEFPNYQQRFHHRMKEHGFKPDAPGQYARKSKGTGDLRCRELVDGKKCGQRYERPQDLGRHKWFAHGIRGIHAAKNGTHKTNGRVIHVEPTEASPTITPYDLQLEGTAAFTAGQSYEIIRQRAEAAGLPYVALAERVYEFVRATASGPKLGRPHRVPLLSKDSAA